MRKILLVVVGALVVVALGLGVFLYVNGHRDKGVAKSATAVPTECQVSQDALRQAHTTNPWHFSVPAPDKDGVRRIQCYWQQTKGEDGVDARYLGVNISHHPDAASATNEFTTWSHDAQRVPAIGDEAATRHNPDFDQMTDLEVVAHKGTTVVRVGLTAADQGFFSASPTPADKVQEMASAIARDVLSRA
ncbi:hypothetical protein ACFQ1S_11020 [Kibdelosporangium lantanae]|uniref:DUF3558 domain-containing protein n=1 Tax=Kibdelosporangium lantanae TaxID=1497396 RepID=A0ABW3M5R6_9PSEU